MSSKVVVLPQTNTLPISYEQNEEAAKAFAQEQHARSTRRAYESDIRLFVIWCEQRGCASLPSAPQTISAFIAHEAEGGVSMSTISRRVAAIQYWHRLSGHESPTSSELIKATLKGIRRTLGVTPVQKTPATAERMTEMLRNIPNTLQGKRDKALLLLGFAGAFRRSELSALKVEDVEEIEHGFRVMIRKSKTDQEGQGQEIAIYRGVRLRAIEAVNDWL